MRFTMKLLANTLVFLGLATRKPQRRYVAKTFAPVGGKYR